jgi:UDP-N-acetylglucosamine 2-epimerase
MTSMLHSALLVLGTRPEAIKLAPIYWQLRAANTMWRLHLCVTGQHRSLLDDVLGPFGIVPDYDLQVMEPNQRTSAVAAAVLARLGKLVEELAPSVILVQGDTTSAAAAGMLGFYADVPVGHVEAGLRTGDMQRPFPEEFNRRVLSLAASWHFAPTQRAADNLLREGITPDRILVTGNTGIDALVHALQMPFVWDQSPLVCLDRSRPILTVTLHRRESFGTPLDGLGDALRGFALAHPEVQIALPMHPNPHVQTSLRPRLHDVSSIYILPPLQYLPFINLLSASIAILTDSGGIQEEAPSLGKPILVARDVTERPEAVEAGLATLIGTDPDRVRAALDSVVGLPARSVTGTVLPNPFGDGHASERIVAFLARKLVPDCVHDSSLRPFA